MNGKYCYTLLLVILLQNVCLAQYDKSNSADEKKITNFKEDTHTLTAFKNERSSVIVPFDSIRFTDLRFDTTFIAMVFPLLHVSKTYNTKLNLANGFAGNVANYCNAYYATANNHTGKELVCYVKKFAITLQHDLLEHANIQGLQHEPVNEVNIEVECYYKNGDTLYPAVRFDTSYAHHFPGIILNMPAVIKELLQPLLHKIEQANFNNIIKRKAYTQQEITNRYAERFNIPVLKTAAYKKGIYKSFAEFKNNAPAITEFKIATEKIKINSGSSKNIDATSLLYRAFQKNNTAVYLYDSQDRLIAPADIFGYCDGKTIWVEHGSFFFPLTKTGNAFEFMYIYHFADANGRTNTVYILTPLNMETGQSN